MTDQDIKGPGYRVWYDAAARTLHFEGLLRLATSEYRPIDELLEAVLKTNPAALHLRLTQLEFLNSSGINMLYKFAIAVRKRPEVKIRVNGSSAIAWQNKSLPNLKKFHPNLELVID